MDQYYEFGAFFARVSFKPGSRPNEEIVYDNFNGGEISHPKTTKVAPRLTAAGGRRRSCRPERSEGPSGTTSGSVAGARSFAALRMTSYLPPQLLSDNPATLITR